METLVRRRLVRSGLKPGELNRTALSYVTAASQSAAAARLLPHLTQQEGEVYRRGRNARGKSVPKNASLGDYLRATGLETLFGYLSLRGEEERVRELFELAYPLERQEDRSKKQEGDAGTD